MPISYGMFSPEGDQGISDLVKAFIYETNSIVEIDEIGLGEPRLQWLQDASLITDGGRKYDEFIGHSDQPLEPFLPDDLFEEGDYEYDAE